MKEDYNGNLYEVYYRNRDGECKRVCYFGYSKRDAERLFNSEKYAEEEIIGIKKRNQKSANRLEESICV